MSIATIIERIVGKQRERQAVRSADFRDVVAQIADGKEPDADFVDQVLHDADKSLDDLQKAVDLLQRRREMRKKWDEIPRLMSQRQEVERQMGEANSELEAAESKHNTTMGPLCYQLDRLKEATGEGEKAKRELWDTCAEPTLLAKLADVQVQLSKARKETDELKTTIKDLRMWAKNDRERAEHQKRILGGNQRPEEYLDRAKEREDKAAENEAKLTKAQNVVTGLEREEAAIREQMLVP